MADFDPTIHPHRRVNPLTGEHVLVSPHRTKRPWLGQTEPPQQSDLPKYDPKCYLCPGNTRAGGQLNSKYEHTTVFENDYAAVLPPPGPAPPPALHPLLTTEPVEGGCDIERIIDEWSAVYKKRGAQQGIKYVQIFENKGATMGCSNPHPHGQVWSLSTVPSLPATELASLKMYSESTPTSDAPKGPLGRSCLLCDYVHFEVSVAREEGRVVLQNDYWVALVPWWAIWPFEIMLLPYRRHVSSIVHLSQEEKRAFVQILSLVTIRYDNLFSCSFAYSMGIHQRPTPPASDAVAEDQDEENLAHLHLHFAPPLLRSASVRKFLVGFELMAEPQRDLTPEQAAARLRTLSDVHYLNVEKVDASTASDVDATSN
ncbi:galactose-1-phosphate uridylyltransferase [Ganoderma leucocontextum]|nr:galactose-1-phosphate uridylyltransferase [Ganoderma leucocontextum]